MSGRHAFFFLAIFLSACGQDTQVAAEQETPRRIVTLAPHLAELVFEAGAGDLLVGVSAWSDHPPEVRGLPVVSDAFTVDQEQLALLHPDLLLAWQSGTPAHLVSELRERGYRVEVVRTRGIGDVADAVETIGELVGRQELAAARAAAMRSDFEHLRHQQAGKARVSVFYQVSARPLYTINDEHYIGEIIGLCGGTNVFGPIEELAPPVSVESVIERNPDVLLATDANDAPFEDWSRWPALAANRYDNRFTIPADLIARPATRLVAAAVAVCDALDTARERLADD